MGTVSLSKDTGYVSSCGQDSPNVCLSQSRLPVSLLESRQVSVETSQDQASSLQEGGRLQDPAADCGLSGGVMRSPLKSQVLSHNHSVCGTPVGHPWDACGTCEGTVDSLSPIFEGLSVDLQQGRRDSCIFVRWG